MSLQSINPATGDIIATYDELTDEQIKGKITKAHEAFILWKNSSYTERKVLLLTLASILKDNVRDIGAIATKEMGKPIREAVSEVDKCAWLCEYYAEEAERILAREVVATDASHSYVCFEPIGIICAVMPWNYPYWQVFRFIVPAVMAGNVGVLKHASNVQGCAHMIEKMFLQAGFPEGIFQNLAIGSSKVASVISHEHVRAVTLTGSEHAGSQVAMLAGKEMKKSVLELGDAAPFIIFEDADVKEAVRMATLARLQNCGQSCIAAKRLLVHGSIEKNVVHMLKDLFEKIIVGDPMDEATQMGPMVHEKSLEILHDQVTRSVAAGAELVTGGARMKRTGAFYSPTILRGVTKNMPTYAEETFGPVFSVMTFDTEEDAVFIANDTEFGLSTSVWTRNVAIAERVIHALDHGAVFVNGMVKSDPRLPFGGIKKSGYGRELSHYGMKEFVNVKTVWMA